ncbi:hypothetical protein GF342_03365 [Candidatus Woesearchaeota archaeon]|nr:hypothetical protein [Candidatus Woesearchaeota archaeon]
MGLQVRLHNITNPILRRAISRSYSQPSYRFGHDEHPDHVDTYFDDTHSDYIDKYDEGMGAQTDPGTAYD